jgi:hypothetical protein
MRHVQIAGQAQQVGAVLHGLFYSLGERGATRVPAARARKRQRLMLSDVCPRLGHLDDLAATTGEGGSVLGKAAVTVLTGGGAMHHDLIGILHQHERFALVPLLAAGLPAALLAQTLRQGPQRRFAQAVTGGGLGRVATVLGKAFFQGVQAAREVLKAGHDCLFARSVDRSGFGFGHAIGGYFTATPEVNTSPE